LPNPATLPASDYRPSPIRVFPPSATRAIYDLLEAVKRVAQKHRAQPARIALRELLHQGEDIVPIPGTKRRYLSRNQCRVRPRYDSMRKTCARRWTTWARLPGGERYTPRSLAWIERLNRFTRGDDHHAYPASDDRRAISTTATASPGSMRNGCRADVADALRVDALVSSDHHTALNVDASLATLGEFAIVRRRYSKRRAGLARNLRHQGERLIGILAIEIAGRFVGEHQSRLVHERARDRDTLLTAQSRVAR
jgi:hypothetical protein